MVLIDHQEGTVKLTRNTDLKTIKANVRALLRTAVNTNIL